MKPAPWDWDFLIHRHLEGGLSPEQRLALNGRLEEDPGLRRRLAELAFERAALAQPVLEAEAARPLLKPRKRARTKRKEAEGKDHGLN